MLRDLKAILMEANQKVPPFLHQMDSLSEDLLELGGKFLLKHVTIYFNLHSIR